MSAAPEWLRQERQEPTSSSTANSFTMFLWLSFFRTSNSLIWTSSGRRKLRLLNTLTAYRSPVFCPKIRVYRLFWRF